MPRTLKKDILRLIRSTRGRFFSLTAIVMIGVAFFVGVSASSTIMADNVDAYSDRLNLKDITIYSSYGFDQEDIDALMSLEEVEYAEGGKFVDVMAGSGSVTLVTRVHSYDPESRINHFELVDGRLPENRYEVLSESGTDLEPGYQVGTVIEFSRPEDDLEDWLNVNRVTVVGTIDTPLYLNETKENSTLSNQYLQTYLYIPEEAFEIDYDLEANVIVRGAKGYESFYDAYEEYTSVVRDKIEAFGTTQVMHRHDAVLAEAYDKLNDGWQEYYDGEKEFNEKIADAEKEIADGEKEIADGEKELADGIQKLKDAQDELDEAETDGYRQIADGRAEIEKGREKLKEGEHEFYEKQEEYLALRDQIDEAIDMLKDAKSGISQLNDGLKQIDDGIASLEQAKEGLKQIDEGMVQIDEALPQLEQAQQGLELINGLIDALDASEQAVDAAAALLPEVPQETMDAVGSLVDAVLDQDPADCSGIDFSQAETQLHSGIDAVNDALENSDLIDQNSTVQDLIDRYPELSGLAQSLGVDASASVGELIQSAEDRIETIAPNADQMADACKAAVAVMPEGGLPQDVKDAVHAQMEEIRENGLSPEAAAALKQEIEAQKQQLLAQKEEIASQLREQGIDPDNLSTEIENLRSQREQLPAMRQEITDQLAAQGIAEDQIDAKIEELKAQRQELEETKKTAAEGLKQLELDVDDPELEKKIDAKIAELRDQQRQIDEGLAEGLAMLEDGRDTLNKAYMATINAAAELAEEVEKAQKEINDGWAEIEENRQKLEDGKQELEDAKKELEDARKDGLQELADARSKLDKAQQDIDELEDGEWTVLDRQSHYASRTYRNTVEQMAAIAAVFPVFFFMVAALVCLTTMTRMIDEQRSQIGIMRALGYSELQCAMKYLLYAAAATFFGEILGVILGLAIFPYIIYTAWRMMYVLPPMKIYIPWNLILLSSVSFMAVMLATTWFACRGDMKEVPSQLLRPKSPKLGKSALIEKIPLIWNNLSFTWKVTMRNLFRYKKRLVMTVIGVAGCAALLITGFGVRDSINSMVDIQFDELQLFDGQVKAEKLKMSEVEAFAREVRGYDNIGHVTIAGSYSAIGTNGHDPLEETITVQVFKDPETIIPCYTLRTRKGHDPISLDDTGAVISEKLAENLDVGVGDTILTESSTGVKRNVRIAAVAEMYIQHYMFMTQNYYTEVFGNPLAMDTLLVQVDGSDEVSRAFQQEIVHDDRVSELHFYDSILENFKTMVNSLDLIVWTLIISSMSLAFVVLGNLMNINISERQREIATLKVLGFRRKEVEDYIYKENNVLTALGALTGIPVGQLLHHYIMRQVEMDYVMFGRSVAVSSNILSVLLTVLFGMLVNFFMRKKLKAIEMVESLKSVE